MNRFLVTGAAVVLVVGVHFAAGCYPKAHVYGVGNVGGLIFAVNPPDAEVLLDGVVQGKASEFTEDRYLKVESGTHRLELRKPGYEAYVRDVYVSNSILRIDAALYMGGSAPGGN